MNAPRLIDAYLDLVPNDLTMTWQEWKATMKGEGVVVMNDDSGHQSDIRLDKSEVTEALKSCICQVDLKSIVLKEEEPPQSVDDWIKEFQEFQTNLPCEGCLIETEDKSPVKLQIVLSPGRPPFVFGLIYVPKIVGCRLGWFAQSINYPDEDGWKFILMRKSRDTLIRRYGLGHPVVAVKQLRVLRLSKTGNSLLGEVSLWT